MHALKSQAQRTLFIVVAQGAQQAPNFLREAPRALHGAQGGVGRGGAVGQRGELDAIKLSAPRGTLGVDCAAAIRAQRRARLRKARFGFELLHGQSQRGQARSVVAGLQLDIFEERAVAAHTAGQTEWGVMGRHGRILKAAAWIAMLPGILGLIERGGLVGFARFPWNPNGDGVLKCRLRQSLEDQYDHRQSSE